MTFKQPARRQNRRVSRGCIQRTAAQSGNSSLNPLLAKTIESQRSKLMRKLGIRDTTSLVVVLHQDIPDAVLRLEPTRV